jgi:hypothetical protein
MSLSSHSRERAPRTEHFVEPLHIRQHRSPDRHAGAHPKLLGWPDIVEATNYSRLGEANLWGVSQSLVRCRIYVAVHDADLGMRLERRRQPR